MKSTEEGGDKGSELKTGRRENQGVFDRGLEKVNADQKD